MPGGTCTSTWSPGGSWTSTLRPPWSWAPSSSPCTALPTPRRKPHSHAVVHRDIKPDNVFLTADGAMRLADFGTAIKQDVEVPFVAVGTLDFMAPEVLDNPARKGLVESPCATHDMLTEAGLRPYDHKADVWSVGVMAYEMVVGKPPFYHEDPEETRRMICQVREWRKGWFGSGSGCGWVYLFVFSLESLSSRGAQVLPAAVLQLTPPPSITPAVSLHVPAQAPQRQRILAVCDGSHDARPRCKADSGGTAQTRVDPAALPWPV